MRATTDETGLAVFTGVPTGQHTLTSGIWNRDYVRPEDNPLAPPVRLTVTDDGAVVPVEFEIHRGTPLYARFYIDGTLQKVATMVRMFEHETAHHASTRIFRGDEILYPLVAGRWDVRLDPPRGYLLESVDVDGVSIDGHVASFDVRPGSPAVFVTWTFRSPANLSGNVYFDGEPFPLSIHASLVEPGPWFEPAKIRGGSEVEVVTAGVDPRDGSYSMDLPDGRWFVAPVGNGLETAEPAGADVVLADGESKRQNFEVAGEVVPGTALFVHVETPGGGRAADAVVELWDRDPTRREEEPIARATTRSWGAATLQGVTKGDYIVAAAHPDHLEHWVELADFDPEAEDARQSVVVRLRESAKLEVIVDEEGRRAPAGTRFQLYRRDGAPTQIVRDPEIVNAAMQPSAEPDATGRAVIKGLYAGAYAVTGESGLSFVRFEEDGGWHDAVEIEFAPPERQEIVARLFDAGTVGGTAFCEGGEKLPGNLDLHVVPRESAPTGPLDDAWMDDVVLSARGLTLKGDGRDRFAIGPLRQSTYVVALRPATFDRWTWAFGTEDGTEAGSLEVTSGGAVDLGAIPVDCGPAVRMLPIVRSGAEAPDLRDVREGPETFDISGTVRSDDDTFTVDDASLSRFRELLVVRDLPVGEADLEIRLGHRYFLPDYWVTVPVQATLERGARIDLTVELTDVGGSIAIRSADAAVARLTAADGRERTATFGDGSTRIDNLPEGSYRLDLCADTDCTTVFRTRPDVTVTRLQTTELVDDDPNGS
jgi:hypothetical protein